MLEPQRLSRPTIGQAFADVVAIGGHVLAPHGPRCLIVSAFAALVQRPAACTDEQTDEEPTVYVAWQPPSPMTTEEWLESCRAASDLADRSKRSSADAA